MGLGYEVWGLEVNICKLDGGADLMSAHGTVMLAPAVDHDRERVCLQAPFAACPFAFPLSFPFTFALPFRFCCITQHDGTQSELPAIF